MSETVWFGAGGINWTWYIQATIDTETKTACIHVYDRWHNTRDYKHPTTVGSATLKQSQGDRIVYGLDVLTPDNLRGTYNVQNPAHVFDYSKD